MGLHQAFGAVAAVACKPTLHVLPPIFSSQRTPATARRSRRCLRGRHGTHSNRLSSCTYRARNSVRRACENALPASLVTSSPICSIKIAWSSLMPVAPRRVRPRATWDEAQTGTLMDELLEKELVSYHSPCVCAESGGGVRSALFVSRSHSAREKRRRIGSALALACQRRRRGSDTLDFIAQSADGSTARNESSEKRAN